MIAKILSRYLLLCTLIAIWSPVPAWSADQIQKAPGFLYLATFNVYKLGAVDPRYDDLANFDDAIPERITNLARVLAVGDFDIVALQEVHSGPRGHAVISDLVRALARDHGLGYHYVLSDYIGRARAEFGPLTRSGFMR